MVKPDQIAAFLTAVTNGETVTDAAIANGFKRCTVGTWCRKKPGFAEDYAAACAAGKLVMKRRKAERARETWRALAAEAGNTTAPGEEGVTPAARSDALMPATQLAALEARGIRPRAVGMIHNNTLYMEIGQVGAFIAEAIAAAVAKRAAAVAVPAGG